MHQLSILFGLFIFACQPPAGNLQGQEIEPLEELEKLGYTSFKMYELPSYLQEISGLSYLNETIILCHDDEQGEFYHFNLETGKVSNKTRFGSDDDYEGIAHDDDHVYIVRSSGHISIFSIADQKTEVVNTPLSTSNNIEGLELVDGQLLIACKGDSGKNLGKSTRAVYAFNIESKKLDKDPFILFDQKDMAKNFDKKKVRFQPSGIAIHPNQEDFYITSAFDSRLLITTKTGELKQLLKLDRDILPQTEGIAFGPNGELYLASEGGGKGRGRILVCTK